MLSKLELVEAIENEIVTEDNINALRLFVENLKIVNTTLTKFNNIKKKEKEVSRKTIADMLNCKVDDLDYIVINEFDKSIESQAYFLTSLNKEKNVVNLKCVFNGKKIENERYAFRTTFKIKEKDILCKSSGCLVNNNFILLPHNYSYHEKDTNGGRIWCFCNKKNSIEVLKDIKKLLITLSPIKNQLCVFSTRGNISIDDVNPKFDIAKIVITEDIKQEYNLITEIFKKYPELKKSNIPTKRGILISGIPGSGKTTICNSLIKDVLAVGELFLN